MLIALLCALLSTPACFAEELSAAHSTAAALQKAVYKYLGGTTDAFAGAPRYSQPTDQEMPVSKIARYGLSLIERSYPSAQASLSVRAGLDSLSSKASPGIRMTVRW